MRVGINTLFLIPGEVGGSETYLCETLLAVTRRHPGVALAFITNRENDGFLRTIFGSVPACSFHRLGVRASNRYLRILAEQFCLPGMIRRIRPDLLWSPGYTMPYHASCPQVVSLLDMQYRSHPEDMTTLARWTTHALVLLAARRADRVLTISRFSKQEIMRATGYPGERIQVTPLASIRRSARRKAAGRGRSRLRTSFASPIPTRIRTCTAWRRRSGKLPVQSPTTSYWSESRDSGSRHSCRNWKPFQRKGSIASADYPARI